MGALWKSEGAPLGLGGGSLGSGMWLPWKREEGPMGWPWGPLGGRRGAGRGGDGGRLGLGGGPVQAVVMGSM